MPTTMPKTTGSRRADSKVSHLEGGLDYHEATLRRLAGTIPAFLRREGHRLTNEEARALGRGQIAWAPFRDHTQKVEKAPDPIFVTNPHAPVTVAVRGKEGPTNLATYANMEEFERRHDRAAYPIVRTASSADQTIVLVSAKPWAKSHEVVTTVGGKKMTRLAAKIAGALLAPGQDPEPAKRTTGSTGSRSKVDLIGALLLRPEGCTTADVLEATGWPSVSMPAQAKLAGLTLRKEKVGKVARYWGSK